MTHTRINFVLATLIALTALVNYALQPDYSRPNYDFLPDMQYSPAYGAYSRNPNFADGRTLQKPVAGTLARGDMPLHYQATPEDALRAGQELVNPIDDDDQGTLDRGAHVYRVFCVVCHGPTGAGDGPAATRGVPALPLSAGNSVGMEDGHLFHILTYGRGAMGSYAGQLTPHDRWCVIRHVRTLQANAANLAAENGAAAEGKPQKESKDSGSEEATAKTDREKSDDNAAQRHEEISK